MKLKNLWTVNELSGTDLVVLVESGCILSTILKGTSECIIHVTVPRMTLVSTQIRSNLPNKYYYIIHRQTMSRLPSSSFISSSMCVCVARLRVRACVCVCARMCVRVCVLLFCLNKYTYTIIISKTSIRSIAV